MVIIMTENKRFKPIPETGSYKDIVTGEILSPKFEEGFYKVLDLLNENEELKQFKENVINWVDSQMKFNVKKYIETEDDYFKSENIDLHNFKVYIGID